MTDARHIEAQIYERLNKVIDRSSAAPSPIWG